MPGITDHLTNLDQAGVPLSYSVSCYQGDSLVIKGTLGNDLIQHFQVFELTESVGYKVLILTDGFVPISSIPIVKCTFQNKEKMSENAKVESKTVKCVGSSVPTSNKFKPLTAHPPLLMVNNVTLNLKRSVSSSLKQNRTKLNVPKVMER